MPYKVERGNVSFQCGTLRQKRLQVQHLVLRQKLLSQHLLLLTTHKNILSLTKFSGKESNIESLYPTSNVGSQG